MDELIHRTLDQNITDIGWSSMTYETS